MRSPFLNSGLLVALLWICIASECLGQQDSIRFGISEKELLIRPPLQIEASDGTYSKYVLILWEVSSGAKRYKVFRTTEADQQNLLEVSKGWQTSTWLCDYSAKPGVDYYYAVVASDLTNTSNLSSMDKGFLKKRNAIANDKAITSNEGIRYAIPKDVLLPGRFEIFPKQLQYGGIVTAELTLENKSEHMIDQAEVRYFLSSDERLDWEDILLLKKAYSGFPANAKYPVKNDLRLPPGTLPGNYFIFGVLSIKGEILGSQTVYTPITLIR